MKKTILIAVVLAAGCAALRTQDRWSAQVARVEIGMTRAEVTNLLPRHVQSPRTVIGTGSGQAESFWVDYKWKITIRYDYTGVPRDDEGMALSSESAENRVTSTPVLTREAMPPPIQVESIETRGIKQVAAPLPSEGAPSEGR